MIDFEAILKLSAGNKKSGSMTTGFKQQKAYAPLMSISLVYAYYLLKGDYQ